MKTRSIRNKYIISSYISNFFRTYAFYIILLLTLALLSVFTGIFSVTKYNGGLTQNDFFDKILIYLCNGNLSFWNVFFNRLFYVLLIIFFAFLTSQNKFLIIVNCIGLVIVCYFLGMDIGIIFNIFALRAIIFTLLIYSVLMLALLLIIILIDAVFCKRIQEFSKYGMICNRRNCIIILSILLIITILLQCIIFPLFNNVFILLE